MSFNDNSYGLIQGQVYGALRTMNGPLIGGYMPFGDCDKFTISPKQKFEDIEESQSGIGLTSAHIPVTTQLSVDLNVLNIKFDNWTKAIWGTYGGTVDAGTVSAEAHKAYPGGYIPLTHPGVSAVTLSVGTLNTDYTVDPAAGGIQILADSPAFTNVLGTDVTIDYAYAAYGGKVQAFTARQPIFSLRVSGINTANSNQSIIANIHQWAPDMTKMLAMIEKKHMSFDLGGMLLQDTTRAFPTADAPFSQFFEIVKA